MSKRIKYSDMIKNNPLINYSRVCEICKSKLSYSESKSGHLLCCSCRGENEEELEE